MSFIPFYKPQFAKDVKTYAAMKKQIEKKVKKILADPYFNSEPLEKKGKHDLRGLRSKRIDKNFRIIFAICEECKQLFPAKGKPCRYCKADLPTKSVVFFTVRPHKIVYKEKKPLE
jgi:Txe/YoeB family toxin of Txe-Axe toxin-antitoxin module